MGKYRYIFLILFSSAIILTYYRSGFVLNGLDAYYPFNIESRFYKTAFVWDEISYAGGRFRCEQIPRLPIIAILKILNVGFGLDLKLFCWIYYYIMLSLQGLSFFFLMGYICKKYQIAFFASLFYMFNPYSISRWSKLEMVTVASLVFMPLILLVGMKLIESTHRKDKVKYLFAFVFLMYASTSMWITPPVAAIAWSPFALYLLCIPILNKKAISKSNCIFLGILCTCFILVNLFWILPMGSMLSSTETFAKKLNLGEGISAVDVMSWRSSLVNTIRLIGEWSWFLPDAEKVFVIYRENKCVTVILFLISIIVFIPLLKKGTNVYTYCCFFSLMSIVGIFFSKGTHAPFKFIQNFLYRDFPGFWTLRDPYGRFAPLEVLGYAGLLGISSDMILNKLGNISFHLTKKAIYILIILAIGISAFPFFTHDKGFIPDRFYMKIPEYYNEVVAKVDNEASQSTILFLPPRIGMLAGYGNYKWGFGGVDFTSGIFKNPIILSFVEPIKDCSIVQGNYILYEAINKNLKKEFKRLLYIYNVRYIILQNDLIYSKGKSVNSIKKFLHNSVGIEFIGKFGEIELYQNLNLRNRI